MIIRHRRLGWRLLLAVGVLLICASGADAREVQPAPPAAKRGKKPPRTAAPLREPRIEAKAIDILKAASDRLAAARSMRFTAVISYENPSLFGPPLVYTTKSDVVVQRPDKLRVITSADGPPFEFYYDGQTMMAFAPAENLVAIAPAPPAIDAALEAAYKDAAIYFPFSDLIVSDPYRDIADGLRLAFYIGQSQVVGGTTTDMIAYADDHVFVQAWIGVEDKLPRRMRAVYSADTAQLRHQMDLSDWWLNLDIPPDVFGSSNAGAATRIELARPDPKLPSGAKTPAKRPKASTSKSR
jgi:hypothetical protein